MNTLLLAFILIFGLSTVKGTPLPHIVGGVPIAPNSIRYHASLQNLTGHHVCGGAIVSSRHVLTAAHCVEGASAKYIKIVVGTTNLDNGGIHYSVRDIEIYKDYISTERLHDIAIITASRRFDRRSVEILDLDSKELKEGDPLFVTGFGASEPQGESSRQMHALDLHMFSQKTCRFAMRYTRKVYDSMFCTFTRIGEGTCHGDSGGPLVKDKKLVGLVSWGIPCAVGFPDVHTRITPYITWIRSRIDNKRSEDRSILLRALVNVNLSLKKSINN